MKVVLAGGSGALGRRLCRDLTEYGHDPVVLTRSPGRGTGVREVIWDGRTVGRWADELEGAAVVNLAGELVDRRPTRANVDLLTLSRVEPTRALVAASTRLASPVRAWLQLSTLAIYGDRADEILTESSAPGESPAQMTGVAREWEAAVNGAIAERLVVLRTGIVLDRGTPALDRLLGLARWGVGGRVGSGRQWVSWLHADDFVAIVRRALDDPDVHGITHATAPNPVRNADLMHELRRVTRRPIALPTPTPLVRWGARLLRTDPALALTGRRCLPSRLEELGHRCAYPAIGPALGDLVSRRRSER